MSFHVVASSSIIRNHLQLTERYLTAYIYSPDHLLTAYHHRLLSSMPLEVCRWPVWTRDICSSGQTWHTVVDSGGGRANDSEVELWSVLWVSVLDFLLSAARTGGWGLIGDLARM